MKYAKAPTLSGARCLEPGEVADLLDSYGLSLVDDIGEAEFRSRYAEPLGRLAVNDGERVALAVVSRTA